MALATPTVQLYYSGGWHDGTEDVLIRDGGQVSITRGRSGEGARSNPTQMSMVLRESASNINSVVGRYSPRNPLSDLYGLIGRNTPARTLIGTEHLGVGGGSETAGTSHVAPSVTATAAGMLIVAFQAGSTGNYTLPSGMSGSGFETDGVATTMRTAYQTITAGATGTRSSTFTSSQVYASASAVVHGSSVALVEHLQDVSTTCDDITLVTDAGTTAGQWLVAVQAWGRGVDTDMPSAPAGDDGGWILLADSGIIGESGALPTYQHVRIWARRVTIDGAQSVIFVGVPEADTLTADNHAQLYVLSGVSDMDVRATVEIPAWPQRWEPSGADAWVQIDGAGIMRRLGQGAPPLRSPLRRALTGAVVTTQAGASLLPVSYWPLEDGPGSTQAASGLPGGSPMTLSGGTIQWASISSPGSAPLPDMRQSTGILTGPVVGVTSNWAVRFLVQYTDSTSWQPVQVYVTGGPYVRLQFSTGSVASVTAYTDAGSSTLLTGTTVISDGEPHWIEIHVLDLSPNVQFDLHVDGSVEDTASVAGGTGAPQRVAAQFRGTADSAAVGHVGVWQTPVSGTWVYLVGPAITGHAGEVAGRRIERLCRQEGIPLHAVGDLDETAAMGPQTTATLLDLLRECEEADGGILYEPREVLGLAYRTRTGRYNTPVVAGLDYEAGEIAPPLEPTDDDRYTRNAVTASRVDGSSATYEVDTGPLSTQDPPDGVGRYDTSVNLNVASDIQLPDQAAWLAHLGTVDEARWPTVRVSLTRLDADAKTALARTVAALDAGDRLTISNLPTWMPPDAVDQVVEGSTETLTQHERDIYLVCTPASAWTVGVVEDDELGRVDTDGSELAAGVDADDTGWSVATTAGPVWITTAAHAAMFPFDVRIGGERVTVTAISGASSPQTWTVTRSVNGVIKSHDAGSAISLWTPWRAAL